MSAREIVMLGTASQAPTRDRNHNATLVRWDGRAVLFDPGEGTQRQFAHADLSASSVTRICISHFHGDHCLGLPGMIMRLALDDGHLPVPIHYPRSGEAYFERLRLASDGQEDLPVDARPIDAPGIIHQDEMFTIRAERLAHRIEAFGFRVGGARWPAVSPRTPRGRGNPWCCGGPSRAARVRSCTRAGPFASRR